MAYNCSKKNLHVNVEYERELDQEKKESDENFDYGFYNLDNLEEEDRADTSLNIIVRRILQFLKMKRRLEAQIYFSNASTL